MASTISPDEELDDSPQPYFMHVSARYLDLTRRKLELSQLPRETAVADEDAWRHGTPKSVLEPLIDFWLDQYDWRVQERFLNNLLPQYRAVIGTGELLATEGRIRHRIHFVHKRCPRGNAVPLLFCHGWPGSFLEVAKLIDALVDPDVLAMPPGKAAPLSFHVVVPSIPGFGFSDADDRRSFGLRETANIFDSLMKSLGYTEYVAHGSGWGFSVCRMLAIDHGVSCLAVHTVSPKVPAPTLRQSPTTALQYHIARWTTGRWQPLSFGYTANEVRARPEPPPQQPPEIDDLLIGRAQTQAYSLCDSPVGLLSVVLDSIKPSMLTIPPKPSASAPSDSSRQRSQTSYLETIRESIGSSPVAPVWTAQDILNFTMMQWLPGPEAGLTWLAQATKERSFEDSSLLWSHWSDTPLGISTFRNSGTQSHPAEQLDGFRAVDASVQKGSQVSGDSSPILTKSRPVKQPSKWFTVPGWLSNRFSAAPQDPSRTKSAPIAIDSAPACPPMWASAYQRVAWVRRHEIVSRMPAWDVPDELVVDIRDCFVGMMEERHIIFSRL